MAMGLLFRLLVCVSTHYAPVFKEIYPKRKEFDPLENILFPFREDTFSDGDKNNVDKCCLP